MNNLEERIDSRGNVYYEVPISDNEFIRISNIPNGWNGGRCIRIQIRDLNGHLRQGPDIPNENISDLVACIINLLQK